MKEDKFQKKQIKKAKKQIKKKGFSDESIYATLAALVEDSDINEVYNMLHQVAVDYNVRQDIYQVKQERNLNLQRIEKIIKRIRESFSNSVEVYTSGYCYKFASILKEIFPYGKIVTDESHAIFELENDMCYDITGYVKKEGHTPLIDEGCNRVFDRLNLIYDGEGK